MTSPHTADWRRAKHPRPAAQADLPQALSGRFHANHPAASPTVCARRASRTWRQSWRYVLEPLTATSWRESHELWMLVARLAARPPMITDAGAVHDLNVRARLLAATSRTLTYEILSSIIPVEVGTATPPIVSANAMVVLSVEHLEPVIRPATRVPAPRSLHVAPPKLLG
jgi:hypothetical protein